MAFGMGAVLMMAAGHMADTAASMQNEEFSTDYGTFADQMSQLFLAGADKKVAVAFNEKMTNYMASGDTELRDALIATCNRMKKLKGRAFPDYKDCITSFMEIDESGKLTGANKKVWLEVLSKRLEKGGTMKRIKEHLTAGQNYAKAGIVSETSAVTWKVTNPKGVRFVDNDGELDMEIEADTLRCLNQKDSIDILRTKGRYDSKTKTWKGEYATVTWERVGLDRDKVNAKVGAYSFNMKTNTIEVDSVTFVNKNYFDAELIGKLTYKCTSRHTAQGSMYPRFETASGQKTDIPNIFKNVNYHGGFTQIGSAFRATGSVYDPAEIQFFRNDTLCLKIESSSFIISQTSIESSSARVNLKVGDGNITHPGLGFVYKDKTRTVELTRGTKGVAKTKFQDTYHKMNMDVEQMKWCIDGEEIEMSMVNRNESRLYFESQSFYTDAYFNDMWGMDEIHPFQKIANFVRVNGGGGFEVRDFAKYYNMTLADAQSYLMHLSYDGFVEYTVERDLCLATERLYNYLKFKTGTKDYDMIKFESQFQKSDDIVKGLNEQIRPNGILNLRTNDIELDYVPGISVSTTKNISMIPDSGRVRLKKNRDFEFDGVVEVGLIKAVGKDFYFSYDEFKMYLDSIKELDLYEEDKEHLDVYGRPTRKKIENKLEDTSATIQLDEPDNKSGKRDTPGYPTMKTTRPAKIYYDSENIQHGKYKKESFYFSVDTFTFADINHISNENLPLTGVLTSGIFPDIRHDLVIREHDHSFGFEQESPAEGYPVYGGKATFYHKIDLSNEGLRGYGDIEYLKSKSSSKDYFLFLPDHAEGTTKQFDLTKTTTGVTYPGVELGANQSTRDANNFDIPGQTWLELLPEKDRLDVRNTVGKFKMFPTTKRDGGFECDMSGLLSVTPKGLLGIGRSDMGLSVLEGTVMAFTDHTMKADTAYFASYTYENQQMTLQDGELRKDIVGNERKGGDKNIYNKYFTNIQKEDKKKYPNEAIKEDTIMHRIALADRKIAKQLINRSQSCLIDFDTREGYFSFMAAGGNDLEFQSVKYTTMVKNYTWNIDRNKMTIGQKGSKGNRFVCTKERGDSLNFLVPVATFDRNQGVLQCEDVEYINVADAKVNLSPGTMVTIRKNAMMDQLQKTNIEVRTDSTFHTFQKADINIIGAKEYKGYGQYTFVDNEQGKHTIFMGDIHTDDAITLARGNTSSDIPLDKHFDFNGDLILWGARQNLEYDGGAKMHHAAAHGPKEYVRFNTVLDLKKIRIPIGARTFKTTSGDDKKKEDETYRAFYITRDSTHVYTSFLEGREGATDLTMMTTPEECVLYYNRVFDRFELNTPWKIEKPDTTGSVMAFVPSEDAITGFGRVDMRAFLSKKEYNNFLIASAGDIKHDRGKNAITLNLMSEWDFFINQQILTFIYKDILASEAPKCDSTSYRYERRRAELYDTTAIKAIDEIKSKSPLDPKTGLIAMDGPVFTFDNLALTWSTPKRSYVCDTTVNLMMMKYSNINRKVKIKAEFLAKKNGGSRIRMQMTLDSDKWYYFDFKTGVNGKNNRLSMLSSNPDFFQMVEGIDLSARRERSRNTENIIAPNSYRDNFLSTFGLNYIPDDPYRDPDEMTGTNAEQENEAENADNEEAEEDEEEEEETEENEGDETTAQQEGDAENGEKEEESGVENEGPNENTNE